MSSFPSWLPFFQWAEKSALGQAMQQSAWAFATIESVHLLAFAAIGGAVLIVDLRLLGFGLTRRPIYELAQDAQPWLIASLVVLLVTGTALFFSESIKCYYSTPFAVKIASLAVAMLFTFTVRRKVLRLDEGRVRPLYFKLIALVSLALWFGVGAGGRWIGFSG